jgi:hypothetical protein
MLKGFLKAKRILKQIEIETRQRNQENKNR